MRYLIYDQDVNVGEAEGPNEDSALDQFRCARGYTIDAPLSTVPVPSEPEPEHIPYPIWESMIAVYVAMFAI